MFFKLKKILKKIKTYLEKFLLIKKIYLYSQKIKNLIINNFIINKIIIFLNNNPKYKKYFIYIFFLKLIIKVFLIYLFFF